MFRRLFAIFISVLAVAAVAAGCGSSDDGGADSLTKAEFVEQANKACKEVNKETQKRLIAASKLLQNAPAGKGNPEEQLVKNIIVPALTEQAEKLEALGVPGEDDGEVDAIMEALEDVTKEAEQNPVGTVAKGDPFLEVDQLMKDYGIEACRH